MRIHVLSVGGRIMHNLAIDLKKKGHEVTGSDDEIYEPSKSNLIKAGIYPAQIGWHESNINKSIDVVILGMHARADNPELNKALEIGLKVMSYPEFIAVEAKNKKKIVVAGSHGKTSTTSMIMHVLKKKGIDFDYLVGANLDGFDSMIKLTDAPLMIIEGDEYLSSAIDRSAKMLHYDPDIAIITGIEWDHINVFPSFESYRKQFEVFVENMRMGSKLFFFMPDPELTRIMLELSSDAERISYEYINHDKRGRLIHNGEKIELSVFGLHNLANMQAAYLACAELGISKDAFVSAIKDFKGAAKRLELIHNSESLIAYRDFAHAPSKVRATCQAIRQKFANKKITAVLELHTYSSLNKDFIPHYKGTLEDMDRVILYYNEETLAIKKMPDLDNLFLEDSLDHKNLIICTETNDLKENINIALTKDTEVLLFMSSGNYGKLALDQFFVKRSN